MSISAKLGSYAVKSIDSVWYTTFYSSVGNENKLILLSICANLNTSPCASCKGRPFKRSGRIKKTVCLPNACI